ncbi:MAG: biotin--[acetyl-CoA-carboxylase] ligase [Eubacteriales bacterium]|nr:biotin--[acetyl-CoA-carboxylase] ligase [Eubacteriales bacterium]
MKQKILTLLKQQQGYVSGQEISNTFGVTRTAIWKYINALREEGYEIESMTRKGYRLVNSPDFLSEEEIRNCLTENVLPGELKIFDTIDSTNEEAKRAFQRGAGDRSLYVSEEQTAGKGRRGRNWISPKGQDVFFSFLLQPDLPPESASMITLVAALAGVKAVEKHTSARCQIKWPNDLVINGRKVCGILTEMSADMDQIHYVVPGIGFNLNRTEFDETIASIASSVYVETGCKVERNAFLADYVMEFMKRYDLFLKEQNLSAFMEEYNQHLINVGREVKIIRRNDEVIRKALGINERGELQVADESGTIENVFSGEVSVRGLYGYV